MQFFYHFTAQDLENIEKRLTSYEKEQVELCLDIKKNRTTVENLSKDALITTEATNNVSRDLVILNETVSQHVEEMGCHDSSIKFQNKDNLRAHIKKNHHKRRGQICPQCGITFNTIYELEAHLTGSHSQAKSIACSICNMTFVTKWRLSKHMLLHSDKKSKTCHFFNNGKICPYEEYGCKFKHEVAKECPVREKCSRSKCPLRHM